MAKAVKIGVATIILMAVSACVAGSCESAHAASGGWLSAFLLGLWHGVIGPLTLIVEIINHFLPHLLPWKARLFEAKDNSVAYDLGLFLGLAGSPIALWSRRR